MKDFSGIFTAIITPFYENLEINLDLLEELVKFQEKNGITGIVPCGTNGEFSSLSLDEAKQVIKTVAQSRSNCIVVAGIGRNSLMEVIELSNFSEGLVNAVMVLPPFYFKQVTEIGLYEYYKRILESTKIPCFIYNIPKYTGISITVQLIRKLKKFTNFIGIKDSSGNILTTEEFIKEFPNLTIFGGSDALILDSLKKGAHGGISALSNVFPSEIIEIYNKFKKGKISEASLFQEEIKKIRTIFKKYNSISAFKQYLLELGFNKSFVRPPLTNLSINDFNSLRNQIKQILS
ncbi:MAG: 4-hydroxy-tetrahydrodipicolinate synthase [Candidatus Helarchaeota archaeon]